MTRYRATIKITLHDEDVEALHQATGIEARCNYFGGPIPSASATIDLSLDGSDATTALQEALQVAADAAAAC